MVIDAQVKGSITGNSCSKGFFFFFLIILLVRWLVNLKVV